MPSQPLHWNLEEGHVKDLKVFETGGSWHVSNKNESSLNMGNESVREGVRHRLTHKVVVKLVHRVIVWGT
jgi:hypothetical protein